MIHRSDSQLNLDLIVFNNRNKNYGAFNLRQSYNSHVKNAFLLVLLFSGLCTLGLFIFSSREEVAIFPNKPHVLEDIPMTEIVFEKPKASSAGKAAAPSKPVESTSAKQNYTIVADSKRVTDSDPTPGEGAPDRSSATGGLGMDTASKAGDGPDLGEEPEISLKEEPRSEFYADIMPSFPGGEKQMVNYIQNHLRFPFEDGVSGKVFVEFVIAADGSITQVQLLKGIHPAFDDEAMRVISKMPKWTPGKFKGRNVQVRKVIPINFVVD